MKKPEHPLPAYPGQISERAEVRVGVPLPMGTHKDGAGVNFAFFSRHARRVWLQLFELPDGTPFRVIAQDPASNRTNDVWHVRVEGVRPSQLYRIGWTARTIPGKNIVTISTNLCWTPLRRQFHRCRVRISGLLWIAKMTGVVYGNS